MALCSQGGKTRNCQDSHPEMVQKIPFLSEISQLKLHSLQHSLINYYLKYDNFFVYFLCQT